MHELSLQSSSPITKPVHDEGHDVNQSGGGINILLEINYVIINRIKHLQL